MNESNTAAAKSATTFRVLVVDDRELVRRKVQRTISEIDAPFEVDIVGASTRDGAIKALDSGYVDVAVLDLFLDDKNPDGFEIVNEMAMRGTCCRVILMTHFDTSRHFDDIMRVVTRIDNPKVVNFFRSEAQSANLPQSLGHLFEVFARSYVEVQGLDFASALVNTRRSRYPEDRNRLRDNVSEVAVEIERLCRRLFGRSIYTERKTTVRVRLEPLERRGLSSAVLLRAVIETRVLKSSAPSTFECVLKLGPVEDIQIEVSRYQEFVRYGIHLAQRVELLGWSSDQGIGAIAYSFAGGVHGDSLVTLDELLRIESPLALEIVNQLFSTFDWYGVDAGRGEIRPHIEAEMSKRLSLAVERNMQSLQKLSRDVPGVRYDWGHEGKPSHLRVADAPALTLPGKQFLDGEWMFEEFPQCLVHGDLHGGNVMAEVTGSLPSENAELARVCLIDYRSAGPGPRCIDAVALEGSVRIAHAEQIAKQHGGCDAKTIDGDNFLRAAVATTRLVDSERRLYEVALLGARGKSPTGQWAQLCSAVISGTRKSFDDEPVTAAEYLQAGVFYAVRQLGYSLDPLVRIRLAVWLSALHALAARDL